MGFSSQEYGVGCHFLLQGLPNPGLNPYFLHWGQIFYYLSHQESQIKVKVAQSCLTVATPWTSSRGQITGVSSFFPSPADLPNPGIKWGCLLHFRQILYQLSYQGNPSCCCLVAKSCPMSYGHMDCSPPGSSVYGILQARTLERVAISFSRGSSWSKDGTHGSWLGRWNHLGSPVRVEREVNTLVLSMYRSVLRKFCFYFILKYLKKLFYLFGCVRS